MAERSLDNLGKLQRAVMEIVWELGEASVSQVRARLGRRKPPAYTTVLSVMQKLEKTGWLAHREAGRAYVYIPSCTREEAGRAAAQQLLSQGVPFDGVFATSDLAAIGAMRALHDAGINVPGDVSIVGYDDLAAARMAEPAITTIAQDTRLAGETLVETLIAKIDEHAPESVLLPVKLVVRGSS